ncbi:hypothetical protein PVL29_020373 [Vitis rotundifolia]|uniref:Neprosin PEP catalytic domain-containing protein n=1 Tax=Vitis rotundifolia TaxID=103349 RepID=A0AA39DF15_VITRO|nr:hypothetical protein PVL29_020373 [Vitis rotundifolia]
MGIKEIIGCYSVLFLLIIVDADGVWSISKEEDMELEKQLKILNKPAVKTIRTDSDQIFDCVDIHKQPSLDHPLLKNHKVQMTFDDFSESMKDRPLKGKGLSGFGVGCPIGTVPIRRVEKEDLIRAKAFSKLHMKTYAKNSHPLADTPIHLSAKLAANDKPIYGVASILNVYKPTLISPDQVSGSIIYLSTGFGDDSKSVVSVGWAVMPPVYRDNFTHLFAYWTADNGKTTGCYDILCPGFVQQSPDFALGRTFPGSNYRGSQIGINVLVSKDSKSGDWYVRVNGASVGYWPKELFKGAFEVAKEVNWGGEIFSPRQPCPPMGSGHFDGEGIGGACYISGMQYQTAAGGNFVDIDPALKAFVDSPQCYKASMPSYESTGYTFLFGGPGGQC